MNRVKIERRPACSGAKQKIPRRPARQKVREKKRHFRQKNRNDKPSPCCETRNCGKEKKSEEGFSDAIAKDL